jgi:hypothetical protein
MISWLERKELLFSSATGYFMPMGLFPFPEWITWSRTTPLGFGMYTSPFLFVYCKIY